MSVNVYLQGDEVKKLDGFKAKSKQANDRGSVAEWTEYSLPGVRLSYDQGRWYVTLCEPTDPIPAAVEGIVEGLSLHEWVPIYFEREAGIYRHETAEAEVERDTCGGTKVRCCVRIRAKKMEDLRELLRMIKGGSLRPVVSYEKPQLGESSAELKDEKEPMMRKMKDEIDRLTCLREDLIFFCQRLELEFWPLCSKAKTVREIYQIIDKHR